MPQAAPEPGAVCGPKSSDQSDKKEEQTNYEINSKTVATTRNSYKIERLSIAVVVNKGRVAQMVCEPVDEAKIDAYLAAMQKIVTSAADLNADRGDVVTLTPLDLLAAQLLEEASTGPAIPQ